MQTNLRTPLARARGLGSAKEGVSHWWRQRLSAVALIPLSLIAAGYILSLIGADRATVVATLREPFVTVVTLLLIVAAFWHLKLGGQVIIEDYVHARGAKFAAIIALNFACVVVGLASSLAVLRLFFGG
jgi:succinate dehydrogenase / fumarate reductase membrane anchor subunit